MSWTTSPQYANNGSSYIVNVMRLLSRSGQTMKRPYLGDILVLAVMLSAMLFAVAALGNWFAWAMVYSSTVGRPETAAINSGIVASCLADSAGQLMVAGFGIAFIARILHLRLARNTTLWLTIARAFAESLLMGLVAYALILMWPSVGDMKAIAQVGRLRCK